MEKKHIKIEVEGGTYIFKLEQLLIDKGMKKTEFAKIAGLTPGTLAKLSKNQTVSMDSLIKMCKTLNCTFDDIVEIVRNK